MAISDLTLPLDGLGDMMIPQSERESESVADALRKAISRPDTFPLLAIIVRTAISSELPTTFPLMEYPDTKLHEMTERLHLWA